MKIITILLYFLTVIYCAHGFPEEGIWHFNLTGSSSPVVVPKSLFKGSQIFIQVDCTPEHHNSPVIIEIDWQIAESVCYNNGRGIGGKSKNSSTSETCGSSISLKEAKISEGKGPPSKNKEISSDFEIDSGLKSHLTKREGESVKQKYFPVFNVTQDGFYTLYLKIGGKEFSAVVTVEMKGKYGYLSAADWPLLPFYGIMCLVYVFFGIAWLFVSFCQWRDLLRIQFWIGGVILLGMLEKATFYAEYQNINSTGISMKGAVLLAECVSCGKRTLARMLVIIVSLGFGIVKPRLGSLLHRVVGVGACYLILAVVESYIRVMNPKNDSSKQLLIASIPLAALDSIICYWIFTSLVQTTRTLRLRRNLVKLNLYRHFTNTLIFAVLASVIFMLYSIKAHRLAPCLTDWKELWTDEAYWHILFSVLLLVIMILWRPTNNNQRYAFTPLLDAADDDEEEDQFVNDAYGVKMRTHSRANSPKPKSSVDDDPLKWVDENIPSAVVDTALPILDSEEEILTTKFEVSKMQ